MYYDTSVRQFLLVRTSPKTCSFDKWKPPSSFGRVMLIMTSTNSSSWLELSHKTLPIIYFVLKVQQWRISKC